MKNIIALLFTISFFVANSQEVDEIINNYIEITGGVEAYQELEGYKIYASVNQQGLEIPIEIVQLKNRTSLKLTLQGQELKQGVFDGEVLWSVGFPDFKPVKSDDEDVANLKNELKSFYKTAYFSRGKIFYENYKWFYKTDFSNETPLVICDKEKVIGHAGILTENLILNGNSHKFTWLTDLIILSKYRNLGLANKLVAQWMNICENKITIPNPICVKFIPAIPCCQISINKF